MGLDKENIVPIVRELNGLRRMLLTEVVQTGGGREQLLLVISRIRENCYLNDEIEEMLSKLQIIINNRKKGWLTKAHINLTSFIILLFEKYSYERFD